ncbi:fumarylacetoacetate hydrolase family protein [Maricaulis sp. CAU 1757]
MKHCVSLPAPPCLPIVQTDTVFPVGRVFCIGRNYAAHAREMNAAADAIFFMKPADAVTSAKRLTRPGGTTDLHHEVELVLALGDNADILACGVGLDLTKRDVQTALKAKGAPWEIAKAFPCSAPVASLRAGPPPTSGSISLSINGEVRQDGRLEDMILPPADLVAALARHFDLAPGDLIFTGTPAGVGALLPGDQVVARINGLPTLELTLDPES